MAFLTFAAIALAVLVVCGLIYWLLSGSFDIGENLAAVAITATKVLAFAACSALLMYGAGDKD